MGQYFKKTKIGTCESMYYMRLDEAQKLAAIGARDDDGIAFADYLKDNTIKWRFPFPDEDGMDNIILAGKDYNKAFGIPAGGVEVDHDRICVSNCHQGGGHNLNIFIPCPYSKEFKDTGLRTSNNGAGEQWLDVVMEGMRDGKRKTIFKCSRCGSMQRFSDDDVAKIKARATEYYAMYEPRPNLPNSGDQHLYDYAMKVIDRIS